MQRGSANISKPPHTNKAGANENERATGIDPISLFRKTARFRRKLAAISALTVLIKNGRFAGFAQLNALRLSDFVRKTFLR